MKTRGNVACSVLTILGSFQYKRLNTSCLPHLEVTPLTRSTTDRILTLITIGFIRVSSISDSVAVLQNRVIESQENKEQKEETNTVKCLWMSHGFAG